METGRLNRIARAVGYRLGLRWDDLDDAAQEVWAKKYLVKAPRTASAAWTMAHQAIIDWLRKKNAWERLDRLGVEGYERWREARYRARPPRSKLTAEEVAARRRAAVRRRYAASELMRERSKENVRRWRARRQARPGKKGER